MTSRVDAARTGWVQSEDLVPPLRKAWSVPLRGHVGRAIVVGDQILVTTREGHEDVRLHRVDGTTGETRWTVALPGDSWVSYDRGMVAATGELGKVRMLDFESGATLWAATGVGEGEPVLTGGALYGRSGAMDAANGNMIWRHGDPGNTSSPAVDEGSVYYSAACDFAYRAARETGENVWEHPGHCGSSGGGGIAALSAGRFVAMSDGQAEIFAADGSITGHLGQSYALPVLMGDRAFTTVSGERGSALVASSLADGRELWHRTSTSASRDMLGHGRWLYRFAGAGILAHSSDDGRKVWRARVPGASGELEGGYSPPTLLAAGPGLLVTGGRSRVTAWRSAFAPQAQEIALRILRDEVFFRRPATLIGRSGAGHAGSELQVLLNGVSVASATAHEDGYLRHTVRAERNAKVEVVAANGARSTPVWLYVYPSERYGVKRRPNNRVRLAVTLRAARDVRLAGRRGEVYIARVRQGRYIRIAGARTRRAGAGRSTLVVRFRGLQHVGRRDYLVTCVRGQARAGMGDPKDVLLRRCGDERIRFRR